MKLLTIVIGIILLISLASATPVTKSTQAWTITHASGDEATAGWYFKTDYYGDQICTKVDKLTATEKNKLKQLDFSEDGGKTVKNKQDFDYNKCLVIDKSKKYKVGKNSVEFSYGSISITLDLKENTENCLINCKQVYEMCSNATITTDAIDYAFRDSFGRNSSIPYQTYITELVNETMIGYDYNPYDCSYQGNGTTIQQTCYNQVPYEYTVPAVKDVPLYSYTGCRNITIYGLKSPIQRIDVIPSVFNVSFPEFAWWNSGWVSMREINLTSTYTNGSAMQFNLTIPTSQGSEIRFTTNSTGTELECGGYWQYGEISPTTNYILNCTLANGTTAIRYYYNNASTVTDNRNATSACQQGNTFDGTTVPAGWELWTKYGTSTAVVGGGAINVTGTFGALIPTTNLSNQKIVWDFSEWGTGDVYHGYGGQGLGNIAVFQRVAGVEKIYVENVAATTPWYQTTANVFSNYRIERNMTNASFYTNGTLVFNKSSTTDSTLGWLFSSSTGTYSINWTCSYDYMQGGGYPTTFGVWSGEINMSSVPIFVWNSQTPADLTSTNIFSNYGKLNVSYNITNIANVSTVYLAYKVNTSTTECLVNTNGSVVNCGWQYSYSGVNVSDTWNWSVSSDNLLPATYNYNQTYMESAPKLNTTLSNVNQQIKVELLNVSNSTQYGFYEIYANASVTTASNARIVYCNSSYSTGNPLASSNCVQFGTILATDNYNHTHTANSSHMLVPFAVNTTTGRIGTVQVTNTSYFLLIPTSNTGSWNVRYIVNQTRTLAARETTNGGTTWTTVSGTYDAHLHQFANNAVLYYYASADGYNSSITNDTIGLVNLAPTSPTILTPVNGSSYRAENETINVSWVQSVSPNGTAISYYNVSLLNSDLSLNRTLNDTINASTSIIWNASQLFPPGTYTFTLKILAVNPYGSTLAEMVGVFYIVSNTPPTVNPPVVTPTNPKYDAAFLQCTGLADDINLDPVSGGVSWFRNGAFLSNDSFVNQAVPYAVVGTIAGPFVVGDNYSCRVNASDFANLTTSAYSANVTILNYSYPQVYLISPADLGSESGAGVAFIWLCNNSETASLTADVRVNNTLIISQTCGNNSVCSYVYTPTQLCASYAWNVTCNDTAGRSGNSSTYTYTRIPTLTLLPATGGSYANGTNFTFNLSLTCTGRLLNLSLNDSLVYNCTDALACAYLNGSYLINGSYNYSGAVTTYLGTSFYIGPYYFTILPPATPGNWSSAGVVFNFTRNYTLTEFQAYITNFMSDWIGYIFGIFIMAIAFLMSRKLSTMFITGGVGMLAAYFMVSNPVFLSASILLMLIGLVMKYLAG